MYIDEKLNWQEHINVCKSKLSSSLYAINKIKSVVDIECLKTVYYALIYPHLTYGLILWGSTYDVYINKVIVMQKRIVRSMVNANQYQHTLPIFEQLNLLELRDIYRMEIGKFMYKYINGDLPDPLSNIYLKTNVFHTHDTRQYDHIRPVISRLNTSLQSLLYKGPVIWNSLSNEIKQAKSSLNAFSHKLRNQL